MSQFVWDQTAFLECLGVLPDVGEDETSHRFVVERSGLQLILHLWQYDGDVELSITRKGSSGRVFHACLIDCPGARYVRDPGRDSFLEFAPAKAFGSRYDGSSPMPFGIRVAVDPDIRIELF